MHPELPSISPSTAATPTIIFCSICGEQADGQHFGAYACRACAAFFRRTVARNLKYACKSDQKCAMDKALRCLCRWCRLQKCYGVGMKREAVQKHRAIYRNKKNSSNHPNYYGDCPSLISPPTRLGQCCSRTTVLPVKEGENSSCTIFSSASSKEVKGTKQEMFATQVIQSHLHQQHLNTTFGQQQLQGGVGDSREEKKAEVFQQLLQICSQRSFAETITPLPILNNIQMGYARLQQRRDELYGLVVGSGSSRPTRRFQPGRLSLLKYAQDSNREINFVAEMLTSFHGFADIPDVDKIKLFKQFWIQFLILERCYDTFRVVPNKADSRLAFPEGLLVDTVNGGINVEGIANLSPEEVLRTCQPWFINVVNKKLLSSLKDFEPTEVEICFCFSLILFNVAEITTEISAGTASFCKIMVGSIYGELNTYYAAEFRDKNKLKRVVELMSLISATEKIAIQRREERLLQKVFNIFKTNIFLDGIFED